MFIEGIDPAILPLLLVHTVDFHIPLLQFLIFIVVVM
jgi:hypothetical protein